MLKSRLASIVNICTRHAWLVIAVAALLTVITGAYSVQNFAINTDVNKLISPDLPWRQRELAVDAAFPHRNETILAVVEAETSEMATQATERPAAEAARSKRTSSKSIEQPGGGEFFSRNGLLFLSTEDVGKTVNQFAQAQPLIQVLVADPTLRGLVQALSFALAGLQRNMYTLDQMAGPLNSFATTLEDVAAGRHGQLLLARTGCRQTAGAERPAAHYRDHPVPRLFGARARRKADRHDSQDRGRSEARFRIRRAGAADRPGADPGRGIRHAEGKCRDQHFHLARVSRRHPLVGVAFGSHCHRRADQHFCRSLDHRRARA